MVNFHCFSNELFDFILIVFFYASLLINYNCLSNEFVDLISSFLMCLFNNFVDFFFTVLFLCLVLINFNCLSNEFVDFILIVFIALVIKEEDNGTKNNPQYPRSSRFMFLVFYSGYLALNDLQIIPVCAAHYLINKTKQQ